MNPRYISALILLGIFFFFFLLTSPLGTFNDWIPPNIHTGFYYLTRIDSGDDSGYYAYLRSIFFDGDIDFFNEVTFAHAEKFMSTGYVFNNWQIGQSVLIFPFFLLGHGWAYLLNALGYPITLDGYSFPYYMSTAWASQTYLFLGLLLTYRINRKFFDANASLIATLSIWLATSLLYYTFVRQRMAHTTEFFLSATFIWIWLNNRQSPDNLKHAALGVILGILCMARVINVALGVLYVVDQMSIAGWLHKTEPASKKTLFIRLGYFSIFWLFAFSPQLLTWYKIDGIPLPALHAKIAQSETSAFSIGKLWEHTQEFFWGKRWGLIFSSPIILVGTIGLLIKKPLSHLRLSSIVTVTAYFAVVILLFGYLDAYEYRYLSPTLPLISLGLAAILTRFKSSYWKWPALFCLFLFFVIQYFIFVQYKVTLEHNDPQFIIKALSGIPEIIAKQPLALLRSTNFITLSLFKTPDEWTYLEYSYLIFYPLVQLLFIGIFAYLFFREKIIINKEKRWKSFYSFSVILIFLLHIILLAAAPAKTEEEIESRLNYTKWKVLAEKNSSEGRIEKSIKNWEKTIQLMPEFWIPHFRLGVLLTENNYFDKALGHLQKAHQLNPKHTGINFFLGLNFTILKNYDLSETYLRQAIRTSPENPITYERLAYALLKKNKWEDAEKQFKTSLLLDPQFAIAHLNFAVLLAELKRHPEAVIHLRSAIALGLRTPIVHQLAKAYNIKF